MSELPEPLVGPDVDLQDFAFMPLHVARLRDSDFAASVHPEAAWYGVLLWAASWHQIPAGSLPNNDTMLMRFVGLGRDVKTWKKHRDEALYGFVLCKDGRLYHPTIAEHANDAWIRKVQQGHRTLSAAIRKHNERNAGNKLETPSFSEWEALGRPDKIATYVTLMSRVTGGVTPPVSGCDNGSNRQGQGQGQGQGHINREDDLATGEPDALPDEPDFQLELEVEDQPPAEHPLTPEDILETWNDMAPKYGLPIVRGKLNDTRLKQCKARIRDFPDREDWARAFRCIASTKWMHGENDRGWRADFDFLVQSKSFTKLVEGTYGQD